MVSAHGVDNSSAVPSIAPRFQIRIIAQIGKIPNFSYQLLRLCHLKEFMQKLR